MEVERRLWWMNHPWFMTDPRDWTMAPGPVRAEMSRTSGAHLTKWVRDNYTLISLNTFEERRWRWRSLAMLVSNGSLTAYGPYQYRWRNAQSPRTLKCIFSLYLHTDVVHTVFLSRLSYNGIKIHVNKQISLHLKNYENSYIRTFFFRIEKEIRLSVSVNKLLETRRYRYT